RQNGGNASQFHRFLQAVRRRAVRVVPRCAVARSRAPHHPAERAASPQLEINDLPGSGLTAKPAVTTISSPPERRLFTRRLPITSQSGTNNAVCDPMDFQNGASSQAENASRELASRPMHQTVNAAEPPSEDW